MQERVGHGDQDARVAVLAAERVGRAAQGDDDAAGDDAGGQARQRRAHQALGQGVPPGRAAVGGVKEEGEERQAEDGRVLLGARPGR
ncbi:hypothetical protein [Streptomyces sp. CS62]|uniref:hypothetical protein n=1 Tax=Streptomyces sp. CS62 TaxID=3119268 RepID=UPI002F94CCE4